MSSAINNAATAFLNAVNSARIAVAPYLSAITNNVVARTIGIAITNFAQFAVAPFQGALSLLTNRVAPVSPVLVAGSLAVYAAAGAVFFFRKEIGEVVTKGYEAGVNFFYPKAPLDTALAAVATSTAARDAAQMAVNNLAGDAEAGLRDAAEAVLRRAEAQLAVDTAVVEHLQAQATLHVVPAGATHDLARGIAQGRVDNTATALNHARDALAALPAVLV